MKDKDWKDWHVVKEEREARKRSPLRNAGEMIDGGIWTKAVLTFLASPLIILYAIYKIAYYIAIIPLWVTIGVIFDPWKRYAGLIAKLVGIIAVISFLLLFQSILTSP